MEVSDASGHAFHRAPSAARDQLNDFWFDYASAVTSGVRLEMVTDATVIEVELHLTRAFTEGLPPGPTAVDVVVEGEVRPTLHADHESYVVVDPATGKLELRQQGSTTLIAHIGDDARMRRVEVWLPSAAATRLLDLRAPASSTIRPAEPIGPTWVHHGSSISQCSEADTPLGTWPALVARDAGLSLTNLSLAGQCQLDQFMARTIRDMPVDLISLELGINIVNWDSMRERVFVSNLHGFLDTIRDGHPRTPLVVISPIICPAAEVAPGPTNMVGDSIQTSERPAVLSVGALSVGRVRELIHQHVGSRIADGDRYLSVVDGRGLFGDGDLADLPDGLHPNSDGYRRMAARLPLQDGARFFTEFTTPQP